MSKDDGLVTFEEVSVTMERDKSLCCRIDGDDVWVPKSLIHDNSEVYKMGSEGELVVPEWWAIEKGLV